MCFWCKICTNYFKIHMQLLICLAEVFTSFTTILFMHWICFYQNSNSDCKINIAQSISKCHEAQISFFNYQISHPKPIYVFLPLSTYHVSRKSWAVRWIQMFTQASSTLQPSFIFPTQSKPIRPLPKFVPSAENENYTKISSTVHF